MRNETAKGGQASAETIVVVVLIAVAAIAAAIHFCWRLQERYLESEIQVHLTGLESNGNP